MNCYDVSDTKVCVTHVVRDAMRNVKHTVREEMRVLHTKSEMPGGL